MTLVATKHFHWYYLHFAHRFLIKTLFNLHSRQYPCVLERILANPVLSSHPSLSTPSATYPLTTIDLIINCTVYMRLKRNKYRYNIYLNQTITMKKMYFLSSTNSMPFFPSNLILFKLWENQFQNFPSTPCMCLENIGRVQITLKIPRPTNYVIKLFLN